MNYQSLVVVLYYVKLTTNLKNNKQKYLSWTWKIYLYLIFSTLSITEQCELYIYNINYKQFKINLHILNFELLWIEKIAKNSNPCSFCFEWIIIIPLKSFKYQICIQIA